jgi:hypothetical protein
MKNLIFVLLKATEISAAIFVPYWVGMLCLPPSESMFSHWFAGLCVCFLAVCIVLPSISFIPTLISTNRRWSEQIAKKLGWG